VTLLELLVALAILGVMGSVVGIAVREAAPPPPESLEVALADIAAARQRAIRRGELVTLSVRVRLPGTERTRLRQVAALPDGSVVADPALTVARLSGVAERAR
jgi:prepilin-type N-terminal cleavage/methylation domain-containing protein